MIHEVYKKAQIARRYYKLKTGEELESEFARKRFEKDKNIDDSLLKKVFSMVNEEQRALLKK